MNSLEFYKGKKVLVTGHTGFKGTWLCKLLLLAGAEVTGYSLEPPTDPSLFMLSGMGLQMHSVIGDVRDLKHLEAVVEQSRRKSYCILPRSPLCGIPIRIRFILMRQTLWVR